MVIKPNLRLFKINLFFPTHRTKDIAAWFVLLVIVFTLYGSVINLWWTNDDPQILKQAIQYRPWQYFFSPKIWQELSWANLTPLVTLSFDIDIALFSLDPKMFYFHQLITIWLCSVMFYTVLRLWNPRFIAFIGASIFLIGSPVAVSSQQLMVRHYIEGLLLAELSFWLFVEGLRKDKIWMAWCSAFFYMAALSAKELYVPLVFLLLALPENNLKDRLKYSMPCLFIFFLYTGWRWGMLGTFIGGYGFFAETKYLLTLLYLLPQKVGSVLFGINPLKTNLIVFGIFITLVIFLLRRWQTVVFALWAGILTILPILPVSESFPTRFAIVIWFMCIVLLAFAFRYLRKVQLIGRILGVLLITVTLFYTLLHSRELWADNLRLSKRISMEGRFFLLKAKEYDLLRQPAAEFHYFEGLVWLRKNYYGREKVAEWFYDDIYLCEKSLKGKRIWSYSETSHQVNDITQLIPDLKKNFCSTIKQDAPLSIRINYSLPRFSWEFGPYNKGQYSIILRDDTAKYNLHRRGSLKIRLSEDILFRISYESPNGWITYSPYLPLKIVKDTAVAYWERVHNEKD